VAAKLINTLFIALPSLPTSATKANRNCVPTSGYEDEHQEDADVREDRHLWSIEARCGLFDSAAVAICVDVRNKRRHEKRSVC
jgi:hypothetical protein